MGTTKQNQKRTITRRIFLGLLIIAFCVYFFLPRKPQMYKTKKKFVILGFDGADPGLIKQWWDELPNLRRLARQGTFSNLGTSQPPESPVAWSCFAVGGNPGRHGVYDFLRRPVGSYIPTEESFVMRRLPKFLLDFLPIRLPAALPRRGGVAFWDVLSQHGVRTSLLEVPVTFPPPKLSYGEVLSGLGVPCIRQTQASFHEFKYDPEQDEEAPEETTMGGKIMKLQKSGARFYSFIWGPSNPIEDQNKREKQKELLLTWLSWCEWNAQLKSLQGPEHFSEAEKESFRIFFGQHVLQDYALYSYLQDEETDKRIQALKTYTVAWGEYYKDRQVTSPNEIRKKMARLWDRKKELQKELGIIPDLAESKEPKATKKHEKPKPPEGVVYCPIEFKKTGNRTVEIHVGDQTQTIAPHEWSDWFTIPFHVNAIIKFQAVCKFYLQEVDKGLRVYMTSPDIDPREPAVPISHPKEFSRELVDWTGGLFKTRGWAAETHALMDGYLKEEPFMEDLLDLMDRREKKLFETMERTDSNVVVSVFSETDRVSHLFMHHLDPEHPRHDPAEAEKYGDCIKTIFKRMDDIVGRVMQHIENDPDTTLAVMSDHGFSTWRYQMNLNSWLYENGYIVRKGEQRTSGKKLEDLLQKHQVEWFEGVDWTKTKAYALGLGQIYINLKGREAIGAVEPSDYKSLCREICDKLMQFRDEQRDNKEVFAYVKTRDEIWKGGYANDKFDCPDIQVGFKRGYRVSWQNCLGTIEPQVLFDNKEKWSADHCSLGDGEVPGMLFCNRKIEKADPSLFDLAPSVLHEFKLPIPKTMEGTSLFS